MPLLETIGSSSARSFGLNSGGEPFFPTSLVSTDLIGYWDAGISLSAPTGSNGTTWKTLSSSGTSYGGSMGDINIQGLNSDFSFAGVGQSAYVTNLNNTSRVGSNSGISVSLSGFRRTQGTFEYWLYPTSYNSSNGLFVNRPDDLPNDGDWFWVGPWDSGGSFYVRTGRQPQNSDCCTYDLNLGSSQTNTNVSPSASNAMPLNTWRHVTVTWLHNSGGSNFTKVYINGNLFWSINSTIVSGNTRDTNPGGATTGRFLIGHNGGGNSQWMGRVGYIRAYSSPLSDSSILNNFNKSKMRYL